MEVENIEIRDFMRGFSPFDGLPEEAMNQVAQAVEVSYFKAGTPILTFGEGISDLYFIRGGAVEIYRRSGELYNRLSEGDIFGQLSLLMEKRVRFPATALEDTLLYCIPAREFRDLFEKFPEFADFVEVEDRSRLHQAVSSSKTANEGLTSKVSRLISRAPVTIECT
ncbi:MAG: cyclic nucleotide-binding domain-containing protein, partial [Natronospirillum sp.]